MKTEKAFLYFENATFMYVGKALQTTIHEHHALQLILSLDEPFIMKTQSGLEERVRAVIIDSDCAHECQTGSGIIVVLNIIPESAMGKNLKRFYLNGLGYSLQQSSDNLFWMN